MHNKQINIKVQELKMSTKLMTRKWNIIHSNWVIKTKLIVVISLEKKEHNLIITERKTKKIIR
jgi:hypothetical protein